jgi:Cu/Ag efflux pump CusA
LETKPLCAIVVLGGLLPAVALNMLVMPALFLCYGVERPGTSASTMPRRESEPVLRP